MSSIKVDPAKLEELSAMLKKLSGTIGDREQYLFQDITQLTREIRGDYPEREVQRALDKVEADLQAIRKLASSVTSRLTKKSDVLIQGATIYRRDEEKAKKTMKQKYIPPVPSSYYIKGEGLSGEGLKDYLADPLFNDPVVQALHQQALHGTEEEQTEAKKKLDEIFKARNTIARAQVAHAVYKSFGNIPLMNNAHKEAFNQREILKRYGISEDHYKEEVDLTALYKGSKLEACSYDPSFQIMKDDKIIPVLLPQDNQYHYLLGLIMEGGSKGAWAQKQLDEIHDQLKEIGRAQVAWWEYKAKNMKNEMDGAHEYAEKLRKILKDKYSLSSETVDGVDFKYLWVGMGAAGKYLNELSTTPDSSKKTDNEVFELGLLSRKFESNGNPGTISGGKGDSGGASYGAYQFASKYNIPIAFVKWLKNQNDSYFQRLNDAYKQDGNKYGKNFNQVWSEIAKVDPEGFLKLQHDYVKNSYYDVTIKSLKGSIGFDITQHSNTLKDVIWSRSVQHGPEGAANMIREAFKSIDYKNVSEEELIRAIYKESGKVVSSGTKSITIENLNSTKNKEIINDIKTKGIYGKYLKYFSRNSTEVQFGVWKRLNINELKDALDSLRKEQFSNSEIKSLEGNISVEESRDKVLELAKKFVGKVPYRLDEKRPIFLDPDSPPKEMDCSDFTSAVYRTILRDINVGKNIDIGINTSTQISSGVEVWTKKGSATDFNSSHLKKGDLILFTSPDSSIVGHVGIYLGENKFIHESGSNSKGNVKISELKGHWLTTQKPIAVRRIIADDGNVYGKDGEKVGTLK